jgi:hypothetical protein
MIEKAGEVIPAVVKRRFVFEKKRLKTLKRARQMNGKLAVVNRKN